MLSFVGLYPSGGHLVKRVIGVGGDKVRCHDGVVQVNGVTLHESSYVTLAPRAVSAPGRWMVPPDHLWVLGDNRENSADSRAHMGDPGGGFIPVDDVVGKVFVTVWPIDRWRDALLRRISLLDDSLTVDSGEAEVADVVITESADDAPTIKLVRSVIGQAIDRGASDIHFEPEDGALNVRYRIDGVMSDAARIPRGQAAPVISRIKILADLDISERRLPQDGRVGVELEGRKVDIRVAIMPVVAGEAAVLRILDSGHAPLSLDDLGMSPEDLERLAAPLRSSHGGILATGPTGSGKTTTLYAVIAMVRTPELTLMTIEDPVEYRFPGVNQIQVSERSGLSFATGLRAIVRADPDVIMVGEMRDRESAHIAVDAALTGHLVLSTLHTNDAASAPLRLIDMGIEPYLVASSINCVIGQRLARRLCSHCRRPVKVPAAHVGIDRAGEVEVYEAPAARAAAAPATWGASGSTR